LASIATIRSPGRSPIRPAGLLVSTASTTRVAWSPFAASTKPRRYAPVPIVSAMVKSAIANRMFVPGPAKITRIRFQLGARQ
jgi:hypothetical protein